MMCSAEGLRNQLLVNVLWNDMMLLHMSQQCSSPPRWECCGCECVMVIIVPPRSSGPPHEIIFVESTCPCPCPFSALERDCILSTAWQLKVIWTLVTRCTTLVVYKRDWHIDYIFPFRLSSFHWYYITHNSQWTAHSYELFKSSVIANILPIVSCENTVSKKQQPITSTHPTKPPCSNNHQSNKKHITAVKFAYVGDIIEV